MAKFKDSLLSFASVQIVQIIKIRYLKYIVLIIPVIILPIFLTNEFGTAQPHFCQWICPLGAFYSFFNKPSFYNMDIDNTKCNGCKAC
ncbi:hypothetical protein [Romboutsia lituseburensis]|uniref:hypothetical protein n=1 Tax=Romboutsia lituseburensis TaxID=1537 RepID=UPI00215A5BAD|nr:hypothetical protein [Romboutsia lituseburensis]MCR8747132.1 hypothetical protein [Romboutsia lituseburensis]